MIAKPILSVYRTVYEQGFLPIFVKDNFDTPLQLVAKMVRFRDPISGEIREFISDRELLW